MRDAYFFAHKSLQMQTGAILFNFVVNFYELIQEIMPVYTKCKNDVCNTRWQKYRTECPIFREI